MSAPAAAADALPPGVVTSEEAAGNAFARILVLGPPKVGKTTAVLGTAPAPLVINCDGASATKGAKEVAGASFLQIEAYNRKQWSAALAAAKTLVAAGKVRTIIVDTITILADNIVDDAGVTLQGFDLWNDVQKRIVGGIKLLASLDAHLILIGHMVAGHDEEAGIMPLIAGRSKILVPALIDDWVLLDYLEGRKPHERVWLVGPQGRWTSSGRNVRRSCQVAATIPALFAELGITP